MVGHKPFDPHMLPGMWPMSLPPLSSCSLPICDPHLAPRTCWLVLFFISLGAGLFPKQPVSSLTTASYCLPQGLAHHVSNSCQGSDGKSPNRNSWSQDYAPHFICFISFNPPLEVANIIICHYLQFESEDAETQSSIAGFYSHSLQVAGLGLKSKAFQSQWPSFHEEDLVDMIFLFLSLVSKVLHNENFIRYQSNKLFYVYC